MMHVRTDAECEAVLRDSQTTDELADVRLRRSMDDMLRFARVNDSDHVLAEALWQYAYERAEASERSVPYTITELAVRDALTALHGRLLRECGESPMSAAQHADAVVMRWYGERFAS